MTYTIAARPFGTTSSFVPVVGYTLMPLREAQELAQAYRASGIDAVAFNTKGI